jgi:hypothetical protein
MSEPKTRPNEQSVGDFLAGVEDEQKRNDCFRLIEIMQKITGEPAVMWGGSIVGFGTYHYKYASGREGDWPLTGFSPRKRNLTLYIMSGFSRYDELMAALGTYKTGKACLYVKSLDDVDHDTLTELIALSVDHMRTSHGG